MRIAKKKRFTGTTTRLYKITDDGKIITKDIEVSRDQTGKIIKIGDVDVYKADGSYNLKDLEEFFNNSAF